MGSTLQGLRYQLINVTDVVVGPGGSWRNGTDACCTAWYIRTGRVVLRWQGGVITGLPGSWVLADDRVRRSQQFDPDTRQLSVRFQLRWNGPGPLRLTGLPAHVLPAQAPQLLPAATALYAGLPQDGSGRRWSELPIDCIAALRLEQVFQGFLIAWHQALAAAGAVFDLPAAGDRRWSPALALLERQHGLGPTPYAELRRLTGWSRAQFDRVFRQRFGMTARDWREQQLLRRCEDLLRDANVAIKEVAARQGFVDESHFAKWFRRRTGHSPTAWRWRCGG